MQSVFRRYPKLFLLPHVACHFFIRCEVSEASWELPGRTRQPCIAVASLFHVAVERMDSMEVDENRQWD